MDIKLLDALRKKQYTAIIKSPEYRTVLTQMSQKITDEAKRAPNEATIEHHFETELSILFRSVFEAIGFSYNPIKEMAIGTKRHISRGRADTVAGALVIEFKQPSALEKPNGKDDALNQISDYLEGLNGEEDIPIVGFVTDGLSGCFVVRINDVFVPETFLPLSYELMDRVIQYIIALRMTALSSKNLVVNFCNPPENDGVAFGLFKSLYGVLSNMTEKTMMLYNEWKELFNLAHDISKQQAILNRKKALGNLIGEEFSDNDNEYKALFALQTAYAIIIKIVAYRVVSRARYNSALEDFEATEKQSHDALRIHLAELEDGAIFRQYKILNLLEGDFFSWYCTAEQWTSDIADNITQIYSILKQHSERAVLNKTERSQDFFKALYESMMPSSVRRSLGEFYTKKWLAHKVVDGALEFVKEKEWRGIDPCCGSGTFLTAMIDKVLHQHQNNDAETALNAVLCRVKGIDLNPVAVLTARVNYFINISHLLLDNREIEIPVYLGDASYLPAKVIFDGVNCLEYIIRTLQKPIEIVVPESIVKDSLVFSQTMTAIEVYVKNKDVKGIHEALLSLADEADVTDSICEKLLELSKALVDLERKNWDGIWARIISNFLTTANLGGFDIIVGNPPWVEWKNLPSVYREKIKSLCISRKLFSGDGRTGGISLDICALIASVSAENWLNEDGVLAFLMPEKLVLQQSYEGFRNLYLSDDRRLYFQKFSDWTKSGHPFKPVQEKFYTYFVSRQEQNYDNGIISDCYVLNRGKRIAGRDNLETSEFFTIEKKLMATCHSNKNVFTRIENYEQIAKFRAITGDSDYIGREGIEFYPQELMVFTLSDLPGTESCTALKNIQIKKPKYRVPQRNVLLETEFLHPLIRGPDVLPFHVNISGAIVPFPYDSKSPKVPINLTELTKRAPELVRFYQANEKTLLEQTGYSNSIIGTDSEFYALARVGAYSFANHYVVFRDNTEWCAAVISSIDTSWGGVKRPAFQNHAVSICERKDNKGKFISLDEAHYICGILNSPIASQYTVQSSDSRSFPIRPRIKIPKYNPRLKSHKRIVALSKRAHKNYDNAAIITQILNELDMLYLELVEYTQETD